MSKGGGCAGSGACSCGPCLSPAAFAAAFPAWGYPGTGAWPVSPGAMARAGDIFGPTARPVGQVRSLSELAPRAPITIADASRQMDAASELSANRGWGSRLVTRGASTTGRAVPAEKGGVTSARAEHIATTQNTLLEVVKAMQAGTADMSTFDWLADQISIEIGRGSCTPLLRPETGGTYDSEKYLTGSDAECKVYACDEVRSLPNMNEYASYDWPVAYYDLRTSKDRCDEELESILRAAWRLLAENLDLVNWASCWTRGTGDPDCLHSAIETSWYESSAITRLLGDLSALLALSVGDALALATAWADVILSVFVIPLDWHVAGAIRGLGLAVYSDHEYWQVATSQWHNGNNSTKACIAIDVATVLLHELTHFCLAPVADLDEEKGHASSYMMESVFRWAMFNRYSGVSDSACCRGAEDLLSSDQFAAGIDQFDISNNCDALDCIPGGSSGAPIAGADPKGMIVNMDSSG